jgi:hypothetical protein
MQAVAVVQLSPAQLAARLALADSVAVGQAQRLMPTMAATERLIQVVAAAAAALTLQAVTAAAA